MVQLPSLIVSDIAHAREDRILRDLPDGNTFVIMHLCVCVFVRVIAPLTNKSTVHKRFAECP